MSQNNTSKPVTREVMVKNRYSIKGEVMFDHQKGWVFDKSTIVVRDLVTSTDVEGQMKSLIVNQVRL